MRFRQTTGLIAACVGTLLLAGCATQVQKTSTDVEFNISQTDVEAIAVKPVMQAKPLRVVALANGSAEIIASMGLGDWLVGRDVASTEKSLIDVPIVTSGHQVIAEKVIALKPDVVLIDATTGPASALEALKKSRVEIRTVNEAWTLSDISKKVSAIGLAIGETKTADSLNSKISAALAQIHSGLKVHPRIAFLYLRGTSSIYLMGGPGSGADSLIAALGGIDVGAETLPHAFNSLTSEALVTAKPDILLLMTKGLESVGGIDGLLALPGVAQTPAGKARRVITVDDSLLLSFGPRTPSLLKALATDFAQAMSS